MNKEVKTQVQNESLPKLLPLNELHAAFNAADNILLRKYITGLSKAACVKLDEALQTIVPGENITLYRLSRIIYDRDENTQDKLATVYATMFSLKNYSLAMVINGDKDHVDLFLGVISRDLQEHRQGEKLVRLAPIEKELNNNGRILKDAFLANFPGTELMAVNKVAAAEAENKIEAMCKKDVLENAFATAKYIAAVSSIPAVRNTNTQKNQEFVQGLEKFLEAMRGKPYSAVIIADPVDNDRIEEMCAEYEDIYSQLAPFKNSVQTLNNQDTTTDTEGFVKGVTNTTNESLARTVSHSSGTTKTTTKTGGKSTTDSKGHNYGANVIFVNNGYSKNTSMSINESEALGRSITSNDTVGTTGSKGTAQSLSEQNSVSKALAKTSGESIQVTYENRAVKTLLERIDEQIKRMRSCEDFGMFDTCAYFTAQDYSTVMEAASAFKSLSRGENSSVESSAVNVWKEPTEVAYIKEYLERFYHPEFLTILDKEQRSYFSMPPSMLISGKEMAYQMMLPKKAVAGIPVVDCTEFGREIVSLDPCAGNLPLGHIYHMHHEEGTEVKLNPQSLTAHTFVTGSTGAGKSTTIYKLLDELSETEIGDTEETVKFLVVEPAKGEYKQALAKNRKFHLKVYGTNPKLNKLLRINPFKFPSKEIHIYEHLDRLVEIFNACWPMYAAMPAVLKAAMENAYRSAGWDLVRSENKNGDIFPSFADVALEVEKYINKSEYSAENKSNYKGSLLTRLESLTNGINSLIFTADDLDDKELFDENVIVDLSRVGSTETKAMIMGILILKLQEYRMANAEASNSSLRHVTVLEEAHNLLKRTSTEQGSESANLLGKSVEMLANSIAEMRTYGEGFIIADQSPGLLDMSVIRNTNTKIIMRLPDFSDRELVGKAAGLNDEQIIELARLPKGVAAVYQNEWIKPVLCKITRPDLKEGKFIETEKYTEHRDKSILFDLLDSKFNAQLDDLQVMEDLKKSILQANISTEAKVKLLDYLRDKRTAAGFSKLAALVYDYFKNTKDILEELTTAEDVEKFRLNVIDELMPHIDGLDNNQINLIIELVIREYQERFRVDYPIFKLYLSEYGRGGMI